MRRECVWLAGGCFWGMEELFRHLPGVLETRVGYAGGSEPNPTYRAHEGHAEALEVIFDPDVITFRRLLEFFFQIHDPTTRNRQGNDQGSSYRSALFYRSDVQKQTALALVEEMEASGKWPGPIVTEIVAATAFYPAEPEHQNYLQRFPNGYTCHFIRPHWVL